MGWGRRVRPSVLETALRPPLPRRHPLLASHPPIRLLSPPGSRLTGKMCDRARQGPRAESDFPPPGPPRSGPIVRLGEAPECAHPRLIPTFRLPRILRRGHPTRDPQRQGCRHGNASPPERAAIRARKNNKPWASTRTQPLDAHPTLERSTPTTLGRAGLAECRQGIVGGRNGRRQFWINPTLPHISSQSRFACLIRFVPDAVACCPFSLLSPLR